MEYLVHIWKEYISETELNRYSTKKMKHDREIRIFKNASKKKKYLSKKEEQQYLKSMLEHYLLSQKYHPFEVNQIIEWIRK